MLPTTGHKPAASATLFRYVSLDSNKNMNEVSVYERSMRLASFAMWTLNLQLRRLRNNEPEDKVFIKRRIADFQFYLLALTKLRNSGKLMSEIKSIEPIITPGVKAFDDKLTFLTTMRNVDQHFDEYALNKGHKKGVENTMLEVITIENEKWTWLDYEINLQSAYEAASDFYKLMNEVGIHIP